MPKVTNIFIKIHKPETGSDSILQCQSLLEAISKELGYTIVGSRFHSFNPHGTTGILLLSESHISIHTWPEEQFAILEMVTCKPFADTELDIIKKHISQFFGTKNIEAVINI